MLKRMKQQLCFRLAAAVALYSALAPAQSVTDLSVLRGLAPVTVLSRSQEGKAALSANYTVTGGIQTGDITQATLLPLAAQQQQALQDAFITGGNLAQLADGLGSTLGSSYVARAHYIDRAQFTSLSPKVSDVIAYALAVTRANSDAGKYFFANATTDGKAPASADALAILATGKGDTDIFGKSYRLAAGSTGADLYGNSRPFQTEPRLLPITGRDYFNTPADNTVYNRGPVMNLTDSPSFPSGHTTYGYTGAVLLAVMVPSRYQQLITRAAEYGNDRILLGAHYAMDVLGGRTLALYDMAHLLANDPAYMGLALPNAPAIRDFRAAVEAARADMSSTLEAACGKALQDCAREDTGRLSNSAANAAFYAETQTYNLPVVYAGHADASEDVGKLAPEAGNLLTVAFPSLSLEQADEILTVTEGPGGGFLDDGSSFGVYSRLNLYTAAAMARARGSAATPDTSTRRARHQRAANH
jgi:PAP2 superfamily